MSVGLHQRLVQLLLASAKGKAAQAVCYSDAAAALAAPQGQAPDWLLVDARVVSSGTAALRRLVRQYPRTHSVLLYEEDLPAPAEMARHLGLRCWLPKSCLHELAHQFNTASTL